MGIPLSLTGKHDRLIWAANSSGKFSVKSAYKLASSLFAGEYGKTRMKKGWEVRANRAASSTFSHVKRQGNVPTHLLAQYAKEVENYVVWLEECPSFLEHVCAHDISVVSRSCF
ncbi:hypothetical protein CFP56_032082 [Quercus suber]|uniref:Uncharacterized protein n=1 Tax=Quercus suber TaxID=58331 RepID=A0AAW0JKD3_QUESU